ncbi:hypothetical protein ACTFIY_007422 [Dictyostelium cf. discoideum]
MGFSELKTKTTFKFDFLDNFFDKEKREFIRVWTKKIQEAFKIFIQKLKLTSKWVDENIVKPILLKLSELWQCSYAMIQTSTVSRHEYFELQQEFNKEAENLLKRFEEKLEEKQRQQQQQQQKQQQQQQQQQQLQPQQQQEQQQEQEQELQEMQPQYSNHYKDESKPKDYYYQQDQEQYYRQEPQQQSNKKLD